MVATVVLLQHGSKARFGVDPHLTDQGREQVALAAAVLAAARPSTLVCSPARRAQESMTPLAVATGLPVVIDPRVRERMEYSPEVWGSVDSFLDDWQQATLDREHQPLSGDSARAAAARLVDAVRDHGVVGGLVVIATHGGVTTDMLRTLCGDRGIDPSLIRDGMPNGHVTTLSVRGDAIDVVDIGVDPRAWTGRRFA